MYKRQVYEEDDEILGFSFGYNYEKLEEMRNFWFDKVVTMFELKNNTVIFGYDEMLPGEYYLDTLYVFEMCIRDSR